MLTDTIVTLQGRVGGEVSLRRAGDAPVASFRLASTPRRYSKKTAGWEDGETQWFTVTAWRTLAENVERSVRRGDPVVVHGRLTLRSWVNSEGVAGSGFEIEAAFVGHDLSHGTSAFTRPAPVPQADPQSDPLAAALADGLEATATDPLAPSAEEPAPEVVAA